MQSRCLHFQRRLTYKVLRDWFLKTTSIPLFGFSEKLALRNALQEEHIQRIIEAATSAAPSWLCLPLAKIQGLPAALQRWTGGSPHLLVYSLRVLHHLLNEERAFDSTEQAMEEVYENLKDQQAVASEVLAKTDAALWQQT